MKSATMADSDAALKIELNEKGHLLATWRHVMMQLYTAEARRTTIVKASEMMRRLTRDNPAGIGSLVLVQHTGRPPDEGCRSAWVTQMRENQSKGILILFEGTSLRASIVRGVVTGMAQLAKRSADIHVSAKPREGLPWLVSTLEQRGAPCGSVAEISAAVEEARRVVKSGD
ncbi:MAG: hypothetical protein QM820_61070 [Minicystis sp.]